MSEASAGSGGAPLETIPEDLLQGCADDRARAARRRLCARLLEDGVPLADLRRAVAEDRLVLLPVERALTGDVRYTASEAAARSGIAVELLLRFRQALGLPEPAPDEPVFTDDDLGPLRTAGDLVAAGVREEDMVETIRVLGTGMRRYAEAVRWALARAIVQPGLEEDEVAERFAGAARELLPHAAAATDNAVRLHMLDGLRRDVISADEIATGRLVGAEELAVGFADLVGFTRIGEQVGGEELGTVAVRLGALASERVAPPVRLVKTIGDAVMLASRDPAALVAVLLDLVDAAAADEVLPDLRAGVAYGPAVARWGDVYGSTVNLASRVCGRARPGSVLASETVKDAAPDSFRWRFAGLHKLRHVKEPRPLWRPRRPDAVAS